MVHLPSKSGGSGKTGKDRAGKVRTSLEIILCRDGILFTLINIEGGKKVPAFDKVTDFLQPNFHFMQSARSGFRYSVRKVSEKP